MAVIETGRGLTIERLDAPAPAFAAHSPVREDPRFGLADGRTGAESVSEAGVLVAWQSDRSDPRMRRLYRVALDAEPVQVWTADADITALVRVSDGWLVATLNQLVVLQDDAPRLAIASERRSRPALWLATARGGTCVLVGRDNDTEVWGYHDGGLTQLDALGQRFAAPREIDGRVIFWAGNDAFELHGLEALLESWQAKRKPARKVARRSGGLSLERSEGTLEPARHVRTMQELADDAIAPYAEVARKRVFQSPASGRTVAIDDAIQGAVMWLDATGAVVREAASWGSASVAFSPKGDEAIAFQAGFARLVHVDLVAGVATSHQLTDDRKEVRDAAALGGGRVLAVLAKSIVLRGPGGALDELVVGKCTKVHVVRDDVAILACDATGKKTRVVAISGDRLVELGAFPERHEAAGRIGDDVAIKTVDGDAMIVRGIEVPPPSPPPTAPVAEAPASQPEPVETPADEPPSEPTDN